MVWLPSIRFGYAVATNFEDIDMSPVTEAIARHFLGDSWNLSYYLPKREDRVALQAMGLTWNNGLGYFDRHRRERSTSAKETADAFRYINRAVDKTRLASVTGEDKLVAEGRHVVAGEPFIKAGAYMAAALAANGRDLNVYHREGELAFFDDYIRLYRSSRSIPRAYRCRETDDRHPEPRRRRRISRCATCGRGEI